MFTSSLKYQVFYLNKNKDKKVCKQATTNTIKILKPVCNNFRKDRLFHCSCNHLFNFVLPKHHFQLDN